ncbi:hypothetical protein SASPL_133025 [Salvia splendens]|uniref:Zinc finger PHD-type domain-containing protein n=1 Tax=Salvia splendens TaxID=180675 RepID=A0A8X8X4Q8_SALSN|nr:hypothetical protein SASPL_133025 [Salvia splendens]
MRSRSHRLPIAEPRHDDWVDGSWTVDCVCGVTFDDGEEMVDCDECGVWVHTRCSRYVKSEKSFACDKCKSKSSGGGGSSGVRNESEETEVAEFLVELPTKTLSIENPNPPAVASRRPFRLWADIPMEERVHLQGVPGGEPALFSGIGMSSVFGPQLWKSTGYVPKKFNLRYTEFPLLGQGKVDEKEYEEMDTANGEMNANKADNGAQVLFSLLKKHNDTSPAPVVDSVSLKGVVERGACQETEAPRQKKKLDGDKLHSAPQLSIKKKNSVTVILHSGKRKTEELRTKDQNVKKKVRATDKEGDFKKQNVHGSKAASTFSRDGKHLEFSQGRSCKDVSDDLQCGKDLGDQPLDRLGECATNLASNEHGLEANPRNDVSSGEMLRVGNKGAQVPLESENVSKTCNGVESLTEVNGPRSLSVKEEDFLNHDNDVSENLNLELDQSKVRCQIGRGYSRPSHPGPNDIHGAGWGEPGRLGRLKRTRGDGGASAVSCSEFRRAYSPTGISLLLKVTGDTHQRCQAGTGSVGTGSSVKEPVVAHVRIAAADAKESEHGQDLDIDEANSRPIKKLKIESDADDHRGQLVESLHLNNVKLDAAAEASTQSPGLSVNVVTGEGKVVGTSTVNTEATEAEVLNASRSHIVGRSKTNKPDGSAEGTPHPKREHSGSEGSIGARKRPSGLKPSSEVADELLKSNGTSRSHSTASYQRKAGVSVLRSTSSGIMSKSSENYMAATAQNSSVHIRHELSDSSQGTMKDNASADKVEHVEKCGRPKKLVKDSSRSGPVAKISETKKMSNSFDSKKASDLKDHSLHSSSKVPLGSNVASSHVAGECASLPSVEGASNKAVASAVSGKGEKSYQTGCNPPSKGHVISMTSPASSNIPATLSDEELALLLHQELNSSPRVPRVRRMRHAGSLPQLTGPNATSVLMKRTSSGGKDQGMASRRRTKDFSGDGLHAPLEAVNEVKKMDRKPTSQDNRRHNSSYSVDQLSRKEVDGALVKSVQSMKKTNTNSSMSSSVDANGHNVSNRPSSRSAADDDRQMVSRQTNRTLPGLIAEIMSEGKRMTYEELCNAVLPLTLPCMPLVSTVPSGVDIVFVCAQSSLLVSGCKVFVGLSVPALCWSLWLERSREDLEDLAESLEEVQDRTSVSRKRGKLDTDSLSMESEDNEDQMVKTSKDAGSKSFESHQEDVPKGKRKARKRKRLALQGRGVVRRRRRAGVVSDDESESFSCSSEDSMSSEEEIQGGGTSVVGSEVSASSDEGR